MILEKTALEEKEKEAMKENNEPKNEEGELNSQENKGGEKEENKQSWSEVIEIAGFIEEERIAEEMVKHVMIEAEKERARISQG